MTNTGIAVAGVVTVAALILLAAVLVRIWKRPRQAELEPVEAGNEMTDTDSQADINR